MVVNCGLVGLPNVGKSTMFNALTSSFAAEAANYPFCTIDSNVGTAIVYDERLKNLSKIAKSQKVIYNQVEVVDIAGLVKGAASGEGLGNKFLGHIREVDAIIHVLRCFDDPDVRHVNSKIDPVSDAKIVELELILADLESAKKRIKNFSSKHKNSKEAIQTLELLKNAEQCLEAGTPVKHIMNDDNKKDLLGLGLLTCKPTLFLCNVGEESISSGNKYVDLVSHELSLSDELVVYTSAKVEADISVLNDPEEKKTFLQEYGISEPKMYSVIRNIYNLLDMVAFFTVGEKESRAWPIKAKNTAEESAGVIHSDFSKGFIKADIIEYEDYIKFGSEQDCRKAGKVRMEGKHYCIKDGEIVNFRYNVSKG